MLSFLGYNTKDSIEKNLTQEIEAKLKQPKEKIDSVTGTVAAIDTTLDNIKGRTNDYQGRIASTERTQTQIIEKAREYSKAMGEVLTRIKQINEKNILKQDVYVVTGFSFDSRTDRLVKGYKKYFFKDMKTIVGDRLPSFKRPPFILAVSRQGGLMNLDSITVESFYLNVWNQAPMDIDNLKWTKSDFDLLISEIPN